MFLNGFFVTESHGVKTPEKSLVGAHGCWRGVIFAGQGAAAKASFGREAAEPSLSDAAFGFELELPALSLYKGTMAPPAAGGGDL